MGLVPTMGFLHDGHLSLVRRARSECESVVVSIFVNPTQFGPNEDLTTYPRDLDRDLALLEAEGVDSVWSPTPEVMYPPGYQTWVDLEEITKPLEGALRPGHFRGVATVVAKLFNGVQPHRAYLGQKDAHQVAVIAQMTRDMSYHVELVVCPIVREADGLAMSSRNVKLGLQDRPAAAVLSRALFSADDAYMAGERSAAALRGMVEECVAAEPLVRLQYVSCADSKTLKELDLVTGGALLSLAAHVGSTRLIDNVVLGNETADKTQASHDD